MKCPRCGSEEVELLDGGQFLHCTVCGYTEDLRKGTLNFK